jgi:hypothetical protein
LIQPSDQDQGDSPARLPFQVLHLDESLSLLAIQEASSILQALISHLPNRSTSATHCHAAQLRLTYVLLRAQLPPLQTRDLLALHRHSQSRLASNLSQLPDQIRSLTRS